ELEGAAYREDLWAAAGLINCGASDDGFCYFRCWLVGRGKEVYEAAIEDPDSLADVVDLDRDEDYEAEIYGAASNAWEQVTGRSADDFYDELGKRDKRSRGKLKLRKAGWDTQDYDELREHFPRLAKDLGGDEEDEDED